MNWRIECSNKFSACPERTYSFYAGVVGIVRGMRASVIFGYVLVETLVFYAVAKWLGVGTALLLLLGVFFGGFLVALWQMSRLGRLAQRRGLSPRDSSRLLGDMGLVAAGTVGTRAVVRRVVAKQLQERISVAGARSFARVYQSRPRTSYGSFGGQSAPIVVDESEIVEWSKSVKPEDFAGPRGSSDNDSGKDVKG